MEGQTTQQSEATPPQQPVTKEAVPSQPATPDKELLSDLTVGLPTPMRLLQEAFQLFRSKFLSFFTILIVPALFFFFMTQLPSLLQLNQPFIQQAVQIVCSILCFFVGSFAYLALLFAIKDNEENISVLQAYKRASKKVVPYWRLIIVIGFIIGAGYIVLLVPGIIFSIWFSMAVFVYLVEDLSGMDAVLQSKGYVQKHAFSVFVRLVFIGFCIAICYVPLTLLQRVPVPYVYAGLQLLMTLFVLPIASTYGFLVYGNLRILRGDSSGYVSVLKSSHSSKEKFGLLSSTFVKGGLCGLPLVLVLLYLFVARVVVVQGDSMSPSHVNNEIVLVYSLAYQTTPPKKGDIVIFKSPIAPQTKLIKRIIGVPGEKMSIRSGDVYTGETRTNEKAYLSSTIRTEAGQILQERYELLLLPEQFIVMGDNRGESGDSRDWGPIRRSDIIGKVVMCIWGCPKEE